MFCRLARRYRSKRPIRLSRISRRTMIPTPAAEACKIPMAYISADVPLVNMARDLDRLQELCPKLVVAKTMLAGHFNTIEVADQVNAMLDRFLAVGLGRSKA